MAQFSELSRSEIMRNRHGFPKVSKRSIEGEPTGSMTRHFGHRSLDSRKAVSNTVSTGVSGFKVIHGFLTSGCNVDKDEGSTTDSTSSVHEDDMTSGRPLRGVVNWCTGQGGGKSRVFYHAGACFETPKEQ